MQDIILQRELAPPSEKKGKKQTHVWNINVSTQRWFWERFGALSGCFWEFLGVSSRLFGASRSTKEGLEIRLGTLFGLLCSLLAAKDGISPRSLLESILSFHTDPPTLENDDFTKEILIYSKKSTFSNTFIRSSSPTPVSLPLSPRTWEIFLPGS